MASPGINVSSWIHAYRQPMSGIALAALGACLIGAGLVEPANADRQAGVVPTRRAANSGELVITSAPRPWPGGVLLLWDRVPGAAEQDSLMFREPTLRPGCLKADLGAEPASPPKECGAARIFLTQSASARWLAPRFRAAEEWSETSGYGTLEVSRAKHLGPLRIIDSSLECAVGAEDQETPACSVLAETEVPPVGAGAETRVDTRVRRQR